MSSTWSSTTGPATGCVSAMGQRASATLESPGLLEKVDPVDRRVTVPAADARFAFGQCCGRRARFADDEWFQALAKPHERRRRVGSDNTSNRPHAMTLRQFARLSM